MTSILLIEDASELVELISRELEEHNFEVHHAADGQEGLERCARLSPDLVILDWMLPKMDGLTVLRRLRSELKMMTPVLMLTARGEEVDRVVGLEMGADDYMSKPFSMRELIARVRALLRRMERVEQVLAADMSPPTKQLRHGALVLDPEGYRVTLRGEPVELSRTEFDLLTLLLRNPGRVFGRAYLLDTVWGERYVVGDRSVDNAFETRLSDLNVKAFKVHLGSQVSGTLGVDFKTEAGELVETHGSFNQNPLKYDGTLTLSNIVLNKYLPYYGRYLYFDISDGLASLDSDILIEKKEEQLDIDAEMHLFSMASLNLADRDTRESMLILPGVRISHLTALGEIRQSIRVIPVVARIPFSLLTGTDGGTTSNVSSSKRRPSRAGAGVGPMGRRAVADSCGSAWYGLGSSAIIDVAEDRRESRISPLAQNIAEEIRENEGNQAERSDGCRPRQ